VSSRETEQVEGPLDPAAAAARLAGSGLFPEYVLYEREGVWLFGGGVRWGIDLDSDRVTVRGADGTADSRDYTGSPADALDAALAGLPAPSWRVYGWVGFDFALRSRGVHPPAPGASARLARLIVPQTEVRITADGARISGGEAQMRAKALSVLRERAADPVRDRVAADSRAGAEAYRALVDEALGEIGRGDYHKVILSRKVELPSPVDLPATYAVGRGANTPARSFLLDLDGLRSAGFSPELVVTVGPDREVLTNPLAGTRAAGRGEARDGAARAELEADPKEIHEHAISVREAVAEMRSVCAPGSVAVSEFMGVSVRGSVQHLASTVRGRLDEDATPWHAFEALFPAITASGIPKSAAIEAITRLEEERGLYSGAVVTATSDGELDAALVLRAVYEEQGRSWLRAGAGIVEGSRSEREFEETREKLASVLPHVVPAPRP
jgi:salicylate synthetase